MENQTQTDKQIQELLQKVKELKASKNKELIASKRQETLNWYKNKGYVIGNPITLKLETKNNGIQEYEGYKMTKDNQDVVGVFVKGYILTTKWNGKPIKA